jgi:hypothetical protein
MIADPTCPNMLLKIEQQNRNFAHQDKFGLPCSMVINPLEPNIGESGK